MKNQLMIVATLLAVLSLMSLPQESHATKSKNMIQTRDYDLADFHSVVGGTALQIQIVIDGNEGVSATMRTKYLDIFKPRVQDGVLHLEWAAFPAFGKNDEDLIVKIHIKQKPKLFSFSGAVDVKIEGVLMFDHLDLKLSGASDLEDVNFKGKSLNARIGGASDFGGNINVDKVVIVQTGASDIKIQMNTNLAEISVSGASDFDSHIMAQQLKVSVSGASDIEGQWQVEQLLDLSLSGSSDGAIEGSSQYCQLEVGGQSSLNGKNFATSILQVKETGSSKVSMVVSNHIEADLSGGSSLKYGGTPEIKQELRGDSRIEKL